MECQSQLDEAITELTRVLNSNKDFRNIIINKEVIHISNSKPNLLGTVGYLIAMVIIIALVVAMGYETKTNLLGLIIFAAIFLFLLGRELYKIVRGEKVLFLDLNAKRLEVKNVNSVFGKFIKKKQ
jgi:ABC-type polysaccharide/polyol phosphate export permease